jgi:hypothetical protein
MYELYLRHTLISCLYFCRYGDGSKSSDGLAYGAWLLMNTKDTYFNGPTHSDLTVDGIVYNYLISNHHGNGRYVDLDTSILLSLKFDAISIISIQIYANVFIVCHFNNCSDSHRTIPLIVMLTSYLYL